MIEHQTKCQLTQNQQESLVKLQEVHPNSRVCESRTSSLHVMTTTNEFSQNVDMMLKILLKTNRLTEAQETSRSGQNRR